MTEPTVENYYNMGIMIKTMDRKSKEGIDALYQSSAKKVPMLFAFRYINYDFEISINDFLIL